MGQYDKSNNLLKIILGSGNHLKHVLTNEMIAKMTVLEGRFPLTKLPVCGHCEKLAMWGKDGCGICPDCGTITTKPLTYAEYLADGYDIDATGETARAVCQTQKKVRKLWLPNTSGMRNRR